MLLWSFIYTHKINNSNADDTDNADLRRLKTICAPSELGNGTNTFETNPRFRRSRNRTIRVIRVQHYLTINEIYLENKQIAPMELYLYAQNQ